MEMFVSCFSRTLEFVLTRASAALPNSNKKTRGFGTSLPTDHVTSVQRSSSSAPSLRPPRLVPVPSAHNCPRTSPA
jgi:hypothetical protein